MSNDTLTREQLRDLANGDTIEYGEYLIRVREEPDEYSSINDFDCYGKVAPANSHSYRSVVADRPKDFDGMAELVWTQSDRYWWQPPNWDKETRRQWHTDASYRKSLRQTVVDILSFGFSSYVLEVCDKKTDAYGRNIVISYTSIGACEIFMDDEDKMDIIHDMFLDAMHECKLVSTQ